MIPTCTRPATRVFWPGPCPWTSADGLSTRRYSAGRRNRVPSSKATSSSFSAFFRRSSTGQRVVPPVFIRPPSRRRRGLGWLLVVAQPPRLIDQHDRDAVADRVGEPRLLADQLLRFAVVAQRPLGQRTDQDLEQTWVDFVGCFHACLHGLQSSGLNAARRGRRATGPSSPSRRVRSAAARVRRGRAPRAAPASRSARTGRSSRSK